jgi:cytochrome c oxidase subunit II
MISLLITLTVVLFFVVIFQVARTSELLGILKGEKEGRPTEDANRVNALLFFLMLIVGLPASVWSAWAVKDKFLPASSSAHGGLIDTMFDTTLVLTGIVFVLTHIALFWFAFRYKEKKGKFGYYYPENNKLELAWTIIPAIVLTVLVVMGIEAWYKITGPAPENTMVVEVTGQQFSWLVRYPGKDSKLGQREFELISGENTLGVNFEDKNSHDDFMPMEIHLPVNKPVMFKLGAKDVLHAFYLPHFRAKMDCVPGIPTQFWMTPTVTTAEMREKLNDPTFDYVLACAEFCGQAHWNMKYTVVVETEEEYNKWVAEQKPVYDASANMAETKEETTTVSDTSKVEETQPAHPISELKK